MKHALALAIFTLSLSALVTLGMPQTAHAATCANGVYRAGCVGPNGAAVIRKY
jgi:ABC-type branched-subunit amino acid transport system permease subunit